MAIVKLGNKAVESIVKLRENGVAVDYLVVHQGLPGDVYDASCDGTWLLRKDIAENRAINTMDGYLQGAWLDRYDDDIRAAIKEAIIPSGYGGSALRRCFRLDFAEVGGYEKGDPEFDRYIQSAGQKLDYFTYGYAGDSRRIAKYNGNAFMWSTRTSWSGASDTTLYVASNGVPYYDNRGTSNCGLRPAMILPQELMVTDDGFVVTNTPPETPSAITIPSQINGGSTVTIEWGASTDAEDNLEGYKVERSVDGGTTWSQIYQGTARSTTNTVPFGTESVMYRVKAYDSEGLESGWKTSGQVTVINNTAPTVPGGITVPEQVQGGQPLAIAWGASTDGENNLSGYSLERQVDGGDWAVVYSGEELSFTDTITKGWQTVAYRVRAYDTASAYSGFAVSETREVNNNTPPAIICEYPANTLLGVKNEGFAIPYTVEDEEGDEVTVTETVDGTALRTFAVELGAENSFSLDGVDFMRLLNGRHTLAITAADGASSAVHSLSFEKLVTAASVTLEQPMPADGPISVCVLSVSGYIPLDAEYSVKVTNNALDDEPVWEDCTAAVKAGANIVFENDTAENGFAFNFRLDVERGPSGVGGYITSVQGGFQ